jgi:hypothetical protein
LAALKIQGEVLELLKKVLVFDVFPFLCRLAAVFFFLLAVYGIGVPPRNNIDSSSFILLVFSLFFLLLPVAKKISIGKILTFEREIGKVKEDVTEFKAETREFLNVYSSMITAISNTVNQTVNVHLPGQAEAQEAKEELKSTLGEENDQFNSTDQVEEYLTQSGNDINFALARLRMDLERKLREILGKRISTGDPLSMKGGFLSARQLFRQFVDRYPKYKGMHSSFDYILKVCNAAIHGQQVLDGHGMEALYMGLKMLNELERLEQ